MHMTSAQINAEIFNLGPSLFAAVCKDIKEKGTWSRSKEEHVDNQHLLEAAVQKVLQEALPRTLNHRGMWQAIWPRITYAGTLASKASLEIDSMRRLVPLFQDLDNYDPASYRFDADVWKAFVHHWKSKLTIKSHQTQWLAHAKKHPDWNPAAHFRDTPISEAVWRILTRDDQLYPGLRFSAKGDKVVKYLAIADFLHKHRIANPNALPLNYYTDGETFDSVHHTGEQWRQERQALARVKAKLAAQIGTMTALHTMMDLGFKTIKPDRVMTYLFSQLGWLQTLPRSLSKAEVIATYIRPEVVEEMTIRADVLAASLSHAQPQLAQQAHRLLDIWLVKYGQEPEPAFGITRNLQEMDAGIWTLLARVKEGMQGASLITDADAQKMWPTHEFAPTSVASGKDAAPKDKRPKKIVALSRSEAERLFFEQWRKGHAAHPELYPDGRTGIDNKPKEQILRAIERGVTPEAAFLSVLRGQSPSSSSMST